MTIPILTTEQIVILTLSVPLGYGIIAWAIWRAMVWNLKGRPRRK